MADAELTQRSILDTMHSAFLARALYVLAELGVADLLADGPRSGRELAEALAVEPVPLHQVLRAVASTGVLRTEPGDQTGPDQRFALTDGGQTLREGHRSGTRDLVLTMQGPVFWDCLRVLPERVATGRTGPEIAYGTTFFDYLGKDSLVAGRFHRMMVATHGGEPAAVAAGYDFSWATRIVDVGGGIGTLLLAVLDANPAIRGVVFDLPDVVSQARTHIAARGLAGRCEVVGGSFLDAVPTGGDAYLVSRILHDWDDETCVRILRTCGAALRTARPAGGRLLVVEKVLPDNDEPHLGKTLDLIMLATTSGRERTAEEYRRLLARAGLRIGRIVPTDSASSVIEASLIEPVDR
ncbi:MAG TPA: methyltransferase [Pseudonocardiaceae bacterium]|jgi:hypothetical protein|nr:methyltransferase [Pseudonocardiaceae bacterium]